MQCASALRTLLIAVSVALLLAASPVAAQQTYVTQFDVYTGYAFLDSPHISLFENGFRRSSATGRNPGTHSVSTTAFPPVIWS